MFDVLKVYEREYDPTRPVVCMDEKSKQLLEDTRIPLMGKPGKPTRVDYEYKSQSAQTMGMEPVIFLLP